MFGVLFLIFSLLLPLTTPFFSPQSASLPSFHLKALHKRRLKQRIIDIHHQQNDPKTDNDPSNGNDATSNDTTNNDTTNNDTTSNDFLAKSVREGVPVVNSQNAKDKVSEMVNKQREMVNTLTRVRVAYDKRINPLPKQWEENGFLIIDNLLDEETEKEVR